MASLSLFRFCWIGMFVFVTFLLVVFYSEPRKFYTNGSWLPSYLNFYCFINYGNYVLFSVWFSIFYHGGCAYINTCSSDYAAVAHLPSNFYIKSVQCLRDLSARAITLLRIRFQMWSIMQSDQESNANCKRWKPKKHRFLNTKLHRYERLNEH